MRGSWDLCVADLRSELAGIAQLLLSWKWGMGWEVLRRSVVLFLSEMRL